MPIRVGLVNHVWPQAEFMDRTMDLAGRIAARAPVAVRYTLDAVREGLNAPLVGRHAAGAGARQHRLEQRRCAKGPAMIFSPRGRRAGSSD